MPQSDLNHRLTTTDASFLYTEKPNAPMHVGSCNVYDGPVSLEDVRRVMLDRLHLMPRYRQIVVFPPFGIAHPTWEDDPNFDIDNHVQEVQLPEGAGDKEMAEVGGRVYAQVMPRDRPLWKLVLLQGRADGRTAIISMTHHAMVDGVSGVQLQMVMHDLSPKAEPPAAPPAPWEPRPLPDPLTQLQDAVRDRLVELAQIWTEQTFRPFRPQEAGQFNQLVNTALTSTAPVVAQPAPVTPFNQPLSTERHFAWSEFSFADIRGIRQALGGTINDVVLAVVAGALGKYLRAHGVVTDGMVLRAMCPVSVRSADQSGALGNQVSMIMAPLHVGVLDAAERLRLEREEMERLKGIGQAEGLRALSEQADLIPAGLQAYGASFDTPNRVLNTVSTNVPGPQIPLYLAGRQMQAWYGLGPLASNIGLFNAILSYNQKLCITATVDPRQVPDAWFYAECVAAAFDEIREAAARAAEAKGLTLPKDQPQPVSGAALARSAFKEPALSRRGR